ncbi:MAG TPA: TIM-barrel domain-containing protein [Acidimicrobiales bacterium]|nr:TIM-barrel domain-containing protein [Acidimicrobiales bacterium]
MTNREPARLLRRLRPVKEPGKLRQALDGIRLLGWRKSWQVARSTAAHAFWDWRYPTPAPDWERPGTRPGRLLARDDCPDGFSARFEHAELEVRFLAPDLVRVTWHPGLDPVPYGIDPQEWPTATSRELSVDLADDGTLEFRATDGRLLRRDLPPERHGQGWRHRAGLHQGERVHGLGERALPFDLRGHSCEMWNRGPGGRYVPGVDPIYICIPVYVGIHDGGSYLAFYENSHRARFSFEAELDARFDGGALRYYVIPGPVPRAMERFSDLTGKPFLPPRWALGYHQSRWGYCSAEEVRELVDGFERHNLPLNAIELDIEYMDEYRDFTVDEEDFPDMTGLSSELEAKGIRLAMIVDAGVQRKRGYRVHDEGHAEGRFCTLPTGREMRGVVWPGWAVFPDFTDPSTRHWWGEQYCALLDAGAHGFWHDMNEPTTFSLRGEDWPPLATRHAMEGRGGTHAEARNLYGLLMARAAYEGLQRVRPDRRPWLFSRSGWAGLQRYAWNWTGDTVSTWPMLRQTVITVLGSSLSGIGFTGPDIGGYHGDPSPELYVRWFELAAFLPLFRTHCSFDDPPREPWAAAKGLIDAVRAHMRFRQRLMPYLYTVAWEATQHGRPPIRPLLWEDESDLRLASVDDAFFVGDDLLVAPVLDEGARTREVPLPSGRWYPLDGDDPVEGGHNIEVPAPIDHTPVFVRAGAVIPMDEDGELTLHVYGTPARGVLYQDAGDGYGPWRVDRFTVFSDDPTRLETASEGDFPSAALRTHLHLR